MARNTLLPLVREARDLVAVEGDGSVTVKAIKAYLERDVPAYRYMTSAVNPELATDKLRDAAIKVALDEWPAFRGEHGMVHVNPDVPQPSWVWDKIVALRVEIANDLATSIANARNLAAEARLREQLAQGMPETQPVEQPVER